MRRIARRASVLERIEALLQGKPDLDIDEIAEAVGIHPVAAQIAVEEELGLECCTLCGCWWPAADVHDGLCDECYYHEEVHLSPTGVWTVRFPNMEGR